MAKPKTVADFDPDGLLGLKEMGIVSDALGSYTGRTPHPWEIPVQDADDL